MQGNSLLESFEGERLDQLDQPVHWGVRLLGKDQDELDLGASAQGELHDPRNVSAASVADLRESYYACHDPLEKSRLRTRIDAAVLRAVDARFGLKRHQLEDSLKIRRAEETKKSRTNSRYTTPAAT
jgi:hypothetical protein